MVSDVISTSAINSSAGNGNAQSYSVDLGALGAAATIVPAAITVQMMCPTSLQQASGIIYAGVMNTQAAIGGRAESWDAYMNKFVQFQSPRLLAASKLALRGVQISSYPLNMTEVSKFTPLDRPADAVYPFTAAAPEPVGWAPIVIYNPDGATLELLITVEYRLRFDLDHPASASHSHHPVAPDTTWDRLTRAAVSLGHGVEDIAESVANAGMAVGRAMTVGGMLRGAAGVLVPARG